MFPRSNTFSDQARRVTKPVQEGLASLEDTLLCCRMGETSKYLFEQVLEEAHFGGYDCFVIYFHPDSCTEVDGTARRSFDHHVRHLGDRSSRRRDM